MAVKQHLTEVSSSQPVHDISKIIELIETILDNPTMLASDSTKLTTFCQTIVENLAHTPSRSDANEVKLMKTEIEKINQFFHELAKQVPEQYNEILFDCMKVLYKHITSDEKTSPCVSVVLALADKDMIKPGVQMILDSSKSDTVLRRIFKTLTFWLETNDYAPFLNIWIMEIICGLRDRQKQKLLLDLSTEIIDSYIKKTAIPLYQVKLGPVILCMLRYSPSLLAHVADRIPKLLIDYEKASLARPETLEIFKGFIDTISALLLHYPVYSNKHLEECLQRYSPSANFQQTLVDLSLQDSMQTLTHTASNTSTNARVGLVNLGNTCYMNSVLQALVMTKQFSREILMSKIDAPLFFQIQKLLALLLHSDRPELTPRALLAAARPPDFVPGYQQDSSEFLGYLLEKLHEQEANKMKEKNLTNANVQCDGITMMQSTPFPGDDLPQQNICKKQEQLKDSLLPPTLIQKTFDGKLKVTYQCKQCGSQSTNLDTFRSFELSFPELSGIEADHSVQKLLDFYCSSEKLVGDNQYFCDKCKRLCDGERSIRINKSPRNLILTLKHFRYDQQRHTRIKLMNKVLLSEEVSVRVVSEIAPPNVIRYSLYAAIVHAGTNMDSGHYYTYAQDKPNCWYKFSDNYVTKCSIDELHTLSSPNTPYILFYQMLNPPSLSGINAESLDYDDEMMEAATDIVDTASNITLATVEPATEDKLPGLEDLPPHLRDIVHGDNQSYKQEIKKESQKLTRVSINKFVLPKNPDSDNDDPPPNSCGSNSLDFSNRFIY
ncbi:ubiquitin carboxyl-terminal hydrolase 38 isoform X2 [Uranotaenia lowii]|nr:ubiquitin carboxyl-terminal hydrolase 38 isoform X2 [Uranotaenia lowii]